MSRTSVVVPVKAIVPVEGASELTFQVAPPTFSVPAGARSSVSGVPTAPTEPVIVRVFPPVIAEASNIPPPVTISAALSPIVCPFTFASLSLLPLVTVASSLTSLKVASLVKGDVAVITRP
jgi:hypothetical protein